VADLDKVFLAKYRVNYPDVYFIDRKGVKHKLVSITFYTRTDLQFKKGHIHEYVYNRAQVSKGVITFEGSGDAYSVPAVQIAGKEEGKVFIRSADLDNDNT
jgi:hypothetical protein